MNSDKCIACGLEIKDGQNTCYEGDRQRHAECCGLKVYEPTDTTLKMIQDSFTYHKTKTDQGPRFDMITAKVYELAILISRLCPPGREQSAALTNLQIARMMANAAIACGEKE